MPLTARSENETPLFSPSADSSVRVQVHDAVASLRARLIANVLLPAIMSLGRARSDKIKIKSVPGPQLLAENMPKDASRKWKAVIRPYPMEAALLADERLRFSPAHDWSLSEVVPATAEAQPQELASLKRTAIYWPGGGFVYPMSPGQANTVVPLLLSLNARVLIVPYELAPHTNAAESYVRFVAIYDQIYRQAKALGHELILVGDSAGAGICACMPRAIEELHPLLFPDQRPADPLNLLPDQLVMLAPVVDCGFPDNAELRALAAKDAVLTLPRCRQLMKLWLGTPEQTAHLPKEFRLHLPIASASTARQEDALPHSTTEEHKHPLLSPIYEDEHDSSSSFALLARRGTRVVLNYGTHDILYAGGLRYLAKLEAAGVQTRYIEGTRGVHVYPATTQVGCREGFEAIEMVRKAVEENSAETVSVPGPAGALSS